MLIAVASKDGKNIDQHFGHAERFLVFDVSEGAVHLHESRPVDRYCTFDPDHPLRAHLLHDATRKLSDCRAVVIAQIGDHPKGELEKSGIEVFCANGPIETTLLELEKIL